MGVRSVRAFSKYPGEVEDGGLHGEVLDAVRFSCVNKRAALATRPQEPVETAVTYRLSPLCTMNDCAGVNWDSRPLTDTLTELVNKLKTWEEETGLLKNRRGETERGAGRVLTVLALWSTHRGFFMKEPSRSFPLQMELQVRSSWMPTALPL